MNPEDQLQWGWLRQSPFSPQIFSSNTLLHVPSITMLSPEASMNASRIAPEPMISFSPLPPNEAVCECLALCGFWWLCPSPFGAVLKPSLVGILTQDIIAVVVVLNKQQCPLLSSVQQHVCKCFCKLLDNGFDAMMIDFDTEPLALALFRRLENNQITSIPVNVFQGLTALTLL